MVYKRLSEINFRLEDLRRQSPPARVLMTRPSFFEVAYVINPHMAGNVGSVDHEVAEHQWDALRSAYECLGMSVHSIEGVPNQPDMVFCANQTLPYSSPDSKESGVFLSRMNAPERHDEVKHYERFFQSLGYRIRTLPDEFVRFEGMGDAIWHPDRFLLWGGYGFRTDRSVYTQISSEIEVPVLLLHLTDPDFYHLDTCFSVLDEDTVLIFPGAFRREGLELIHGIFSRVIEAPEYESRELFACNAHCPNGTDVLVQRGCSQTAAQLIDNDYSPIEVDTDEYLKAGGSVFCMKQMFW
jgi:arginine dihydrolase